ncbi:MAG: glycosyltransferase [Galbitalea sp.]
MTPARASAPDRCLRPSRSAASAACRSWSRGSEIRPGALATAAAAAGLPEGRVRALGRLEDADLAVVLDRATIFVYPSLANGFGMPMLEALRFGVPVIHADTPSLLEVAGGAGIAVESGDLANYPRQLAEAIERVEVDDALRARLGIVGADRAGLFSWRASAEGVWQLHADL